MEFNEIIIKNHSEVIIGMVRNRPEMSKIKKEYLVNVDMRWSMDYEVKACSETEAKRLAWEKFKKNPPKKCFEISADKK